ncbi:MAG: LysM peptidoglycan-binding domain-containing protein [Saprospirales bacterium]|nr:LysM peptidoglycan-binding domain-containing protein [Saprospirales bacterium]
MGPSTTGQCPEQSSEGIHIVQTGETLYEIARRYYLPAQSLMEWNEIQDPGQIQRCQRIYLFKPQQQYAARENKSTFISLDQLKTAPPLSQPGFAGQPQQAEAPEYTAASFDVHLVQRGESLQSIAESRRVHKGFLAQVNNLQEDAVLYPGQRLKVPVRRYR